MSDPPELQSAPQSLPLLSSLKKPASSANIRHFTEQCEIRPTGPLCILLGYSHYQQRNYALTMSALHRALYSFKEDSNPDLWYTTGLVYTRLCNVKLAETAFLAVIRVDPSYSKKNRVFFELGRLYKQENKSELAAKYFKSALDGEGDNARLRAKSYCYLGYSYEREDALRAADNYSAGYEASASVQTFGCFVWGYMLTGAYREAAERIKKALED